MRTLSILSPILCLTVGLWACGEAGKTETATQASATTETKSGVTPAATPRDRAAGLKSGKVHSGAEARPATALEAADRSAPTLSTRPSSPLPTALSASPDAPVPSAASTPAEESGPATTQPAASAETVAPAEAAAPAEVAAPSAAAPTEAAAPSAAEEEEDMNAALEALGYME